MRKQLALAILLAVIFTACKQTDEPAAPSGKTAYTVLFYAIVCYAYALRYAFGLPAYREAPKPGMSIILGALGRTQESFQEANKKP